MAYVRGWAWCVRLAVRSWHEEEVLVFRYASHPRLDGVSWLQKNPTGDWELGASLCSEGFFAATGLKASDLPFDTPVRVDFSGAKVLEDQ